MKSLSCLRGRVAGSGGSVLSTSGSTNSELIEAMSTCCHGRTLSSNHVVVLVRLNVVRYARVAGVRLRTRETDR